MQVAGELKRKQSISNPERISHTRILPSEEEDNIHFPSLEKEMEDIDDLFPVNLLTILPEFRSRIRMDRSVQAIAQRLEED